MIVRLHHVVIDCPDPASGQQMHLDVMVQDVKSAGEWVLTLGATRLCGAHGSVYADPAGHPFCLILHPGWVAGING